MSADHATPLNKYYGQQITKEIFGPSEFNGFDSYEPNVIPMGKNDYEDITSEFYVSMKSFVQNKCFEYADFQNSKFKSSKTQTTVIDPIEKHASFWVLDKIFLNLNEFPYVKGQF